MSRVLSFLAFLGAVTIVLGAFAAHSLQEILNTQQLKSFETGIRYQMYHILVLLFVNTYAKFSSKDKIILNYLFLGGILLFSGSIYLITFGIPAKSIWFLTPIGGLLFVFGWLKMFFTFLKITNN
jgi:uncharacterized membrane protein YgdD (TMEM256/DUF423 family)